MHLGRILDLVTTMRFQERSSIHSYTVYNSEIHKLQSGSSGIVRKDGLARTGGLGGFHSELHIMYEMLCLRTGFFAGEEDGL